MYLLGLWRTKIRLGAVSVLAVADKQAWQVLSDLDEVDLGAVCDATVRLAVGAGAEELLHDVVEDEESEAPAVEAVVPRLQRQE